MQKKHSELRFIAEQSSCKPDLHNASK